MNLHIHNYNKIGLLSNIRIECEADDPKLKCYKDLLKALSERDKQTTENLKNYTNVFFLIYYSFFLFSFFA